MPEEDRKEKWVCGGFRETVSGKLGQIWWTLDEDENAPKDWVTSNDLTHMFVKGLVKGARPGYIYEITYAEPSGAKVWTAGPKGPKYIHLLEDKGLREQWAALSLAEEASYRAKKDAKSAPTAEKTIQEALRPIREAMRKTDRVGRRVIASTVLAELMDGMGGI